MRIVHIIPTYNEKENIGKMIETINEISRSRTDWDNHILIVDDHSPDGTAYIVKKYQEKYSHIHLMLKKKEGLGKALIMGYEYAIKNLHADVIIPNDADFQWDPHDFPLLIDKIEDGYDVVVASRHVPGAKVVGWNWFRKLNHDVSNYLLAWWIAGVQEIKDHAGNFKAIRVKKVLDQVPLQKMRNAGFSFQLHILYELSKTGAKFVEIPVTFQERKLGKSKIGFNRYYLRDIAEYIKNSFTIRAHRNKSFVKYIIVGATGFMIQTVISKIFIVFSFQPGVAVSLGAEGAIVSNFLFNNHWTFRHKKILGLRNKLRKFIQFNAVAVGAIVMQGLFVGLGTHYFGTSTWFLFMVFAIVIIVVPYSFFMYNRFIWKRHVLST
ncbi:glycosyltransferase [Candidatus Gottesmanbacteria bacterium]|nr:glycosyltransferase [Candidatus Gottesmanbacteria bacterium]